MNNTGRAFWTVFFKSLGLCFSLLFATTGSAQQTLVPIGQLPGDSFQAMAVQGNYALTTGYGVILTTYDLSSAYRLGVLVADNSNIFGYDVALVGNYAYVLTALEGAPGGAGIVVVDVSDKNNPRRVGTYGSGNSFDGFVVNGNVAYTGLGGQLQVLNLSNPANPQLIRTVPLSGSLAGTGGTVVGNRLYLCEGTAGLSVWDVSQPDNPTRLGIVQNIGVVRDCVVVGNYAFVSCGEWIGGIEGALRVVDVSNPANMSVVTQLRLGRPPFYATNPWYPLVLKGNYLFVGLHDESSVSIVDISNPLSPQVRSTIDGHGAVGGASLPDNRLVTLRSSSFTVWDISNAEAPAFIRAYLGISPQAATRVGNWLVTAEQGGVAVYDVTVPSNPRRAGFTTLPNSPTGNQRITAQGDLVVASFLYGGGQEVHLFNAANLPALPPVGSYSPGTNVYGIALQRPFLLVAHSGGLDVVRVENPAVPTRENRVPATYTNYPVDVATGTGSDGSPIACVVTYDRKLKVYFTGNLPLITEEGSLDLPFRPSDVEIAGNLALVAGDGDLMVVDISDRRTPRQAAFWDYTGTAPGGATRIQVYGNTALLSYYWGMAVFDLTQLPNLAPTAVYDGRVDDAAVNSTGDVVFAISGSTGILALQGRLPAGTSDLQVRAVRFLPTDPADLMDGVTVTVEATVFNAGPEGTLPPPVRFVLDGQTVDARVRGTNLPAGQSGTAVARLTLRPGSGRTLQAIVDPNQQWNDPIRANNVQAVPFPDVSRPDLSVAEVQIQPQTGLVHGEEFTVRALVRNGGGGLARPVEVLVEYAGRSARTTLNGLRAGAQEAISATFAAVSGQTQVHVKVDPNSAIEESAEDNNELVQSVPPIATPDLEIVDLTFAPAQPDEGDTVRVTAKVRNNGAPIKGNFVVAFYVDDRLIYNEPSPLPNLGTGEEMEVSQHFTFTPNSSQLRAVADPGNQIVESNKDNNTRTVSLPQPPAPELEARSLALTQPMQAGIWQTARAEIANNGGTARNVKVQFLVNGTPISTQTVYTLKRTSSTTVEASWWVRPGTREVKVIVDPDNETSDPQRENNSRSLSADVPSAEVALESAQLPLGDVNLVVGNYPLAGQVPIRVQLRNNSDVGTGQIVVGIWADDQYIAGQAVNLAGREQRLEEVYVSLHALIGKRQVRVRADANDVLLEQNESDNEKTVSVPQWRLPDLEVVDVTWTPQEFSVGQTVTFNITVRNRGEGRYGIVAWGGQQQTIPVSLSIGSESLFTGGYDPNGIRVLAPGESQTVQVQWTARPIDNPEVTVTIDSANWLPESNENNNTLRKPMNLRLAAPDFAVTDVQVTPTTGLQVGDPVTIRASVAHIAGDFNGLTDLTVHAYVDGRWIGRQNVALRAGEEKQVEFTWRALPGAARTVRVIVDKHQWETDTANNQQDVTVPLQVAPVDLVVDEISDSLPSEIVQGDRVTTRVTVRNAGSGDIRLPFSVNLYANGTYEGEQRLEGLSAGESRTLTFEWSAFTAERLQLSAIVDSQGDIPGESDETNNRLQREVATRVVARQEVQVSLQPLSLRAGAGATVNYQVRISNSSSQPRALRLQVVGLDGMSTLIEPTTATLQPWAASTHTLQVQVPADASAGAREFTLRVLNEDDTLVMERRASLEVTREPQISGLLPANGTRTGNTSVVFTWRTDVFASSEVFLRATDESTFRSFTGPEGTEHQVRVDGLQRGKTYRFYVVSRTAQGTAQSEERTLTITEAVAFAQREYRFTLDKDFDQRASLQVRNLSGEAQTVRVELVNPYEDVPAGFIGAGGDQPITLAANGTQEVTLALHFQTATRNRYTFVARLHSGEGANASVDEVPVHVTVDDQVDIEVQDLGTDPVTLQKTIRIVNRRNKPVAGLTLKLSDSLQGQVSLDKELQGFRLEAYESVTVRIQPTFAIQISRYPDIRSRLAPGRAVLLDIPEARQQLRRQRQGSVQVVDNVNRVRAELHNVDFTPPAGKQLYAVQLDNRVVENSNNVASCSNQGVINTSFSVPPLEPGDPFLLVDMRPGKGWDYDRIAPQTAYFYVNGHLVGKIENTVPNGLYMFDVPAEFLRLGDFPTTNTVTMQWQLNNYGHFLQVANVKLVVLAKRMVQYVAAESEEEALRIAQNQPFFERHNEPALDKLRALLLNSKTDAGNIPWRNPLWYGPFGDYVWIRPSFAGHLNNIPDDINLLLGKEIFPTGEYACGSYQGRVLNYLLNLEEDYPDLFLDRNNRTRILFYPVQGFKGGHHAVLVVERSELERLGISHPFEIRPDGKPGRLRKDVKAIVVDPWYVQDMRVYDAQHWSFINQCEFDTSVGYDLSWRLDIGRPNYWEPPRTRSRQEAVVNPYLTEPFHFMALTTAGVGILLTDPDGRRAGFLSKEEVVNDYGAYANFTFGEPGTDSRVCYIGMLGRVPRQYTVRLVPFYPDVTKTDLIVAWLDAEGKRQIVEYKDVDVASFGRQGGGQATLQIDPAGGIPALQDANGNSVYPNTNSEQTVGPSTQSGISELRSGILPAGLQLVALPILERDAPMVTLLEQGRAARWNPDKPGNNKYEIFPYPYVSTAQRGAGYWVKLDRTTPVTITVPTVEIQPYVISLRPGWNMIGNPYIEPVLWDVSAIKVRKDGTELPLSQAEAQGWVEGYAWRWDGNAYRLVYSAGTPLPNVDESLPAWSGAWVFAYQPCEMILPIPQGIAAQITRKRITVPTGAWSIALRARANDTTGEAIIGSLPGGRGLSVGAPPLPPGAQEGVQVVVVRNGQPLAADLRNGTRTAGEVWDVEVRVPASESDTAILWWQDVHRAPRGVNPVLVDLQTGERRFLRHTSSHTFAISRQGGVYRFRVELLPTGNLLRITGVRVSGGRSQGSYTVSFDVNAEAQVEVTVLSAGKVVRRLMQTVTRSAGIQQVSWDGRDDKGIALPAGAYMVEVKATGTDGQVARVAVPIVLTR